MPDRPDHLQVAGDVVRELATMHIDPVLVGGMAMVVLGSRRVTRDFDFVIAHPGGRMKDVLDVLYKRGLELVSRLDDAGNVAATITNRRVAAARLRLDDPASAYFFNRKTGLRIDLLFDFPVPAATLAAHATGVTIRGYAFVVASESDLLRLKQIAQTKRSMPSDAEDIAFLEARASRR